MAETVEKTIVETVLELAMTYGIPAVLGIIKSWNKSEITQADIDALATMIKKPEEY